MQLAQQNSQQSSQWQATLSLKFGVQSTASNKTRTIISSRQHQGPLVVQKPFYPEGSPCHVYLLHPPGGLVGGDQLTLNVDLEPDTHTLITTPGAAKFYRSTGQVASQNQSFTINEGALLEWLPQETIIFNQANARVESIINLTQSSKFIGWEISSLGRQAGNLPFNEGQFVQKIQILRNNKPLVIERALYQGGDEILSAAWGLANHTTVGTMMITPASKELLELIRQRVTTKPADLFSATLIEDVIVCRHLGSQAVETKKIFTSVWEIARPFIQDIKACIPRIWNT